MKMHPKMRLPLPLKKLHPNLHHSTQLTNIKIPDPQTLIFSRSQTYPDPKNKKRPNFPD